MIVPVRWFCRRMISGAYAPGDWVVDLQEGVGEATGLDRLREADEDGEHDMGAISVHLHGGPLDGAVEPVPTGSDGQPRQVVDVEYGSGGATWYVQYRRERRTEDGWHYRATGIQDRADEE